MLRVLVLARFSGIALLVGFGCSFLLSRAALAGPTVWQTQNTTGPELSQAACNAKAQQAMLAMGLTLTGNDVQRVWFGESDKVTTAIWCYGLPNGGSVQTFLTAANKGSGVDLGAFQGQLLQYFYGTSAACTSPVGTWNWWNGGTVTFNSDGTATTSSGYRGNWERMNDGRYHVHWNYPSDDYFTISADGRTMPGNYNGNSGTSTRQGTC